MSSRRFVVTVGEAPARVVVEDVRSRRRAVADDLAAVGGQMKVYLIRSAAALAAVVGLLAQLPPPAAQAAGPVQLAQGEAFACADQQDLDRECSEGEDLDFSANVSVGGSSASLDVDTTDAPNGISIEADGAVSAADSTNSLVENNAHDAQLWIERRFTVALGAPVPYSFSATWSLQGGSEDEGGFLQTALDGSPANSSEDFFHTREVHGSQTVSESGMLQPGQYHFTFAANCGGGLKAQCTANLSNLKLEVGGPPPDADRDGDALLDSWEEDGVDVDDDGTVDLDLPAMGADPDHKDIFIEVDFVAGHRIDQAQIDAVIEAFEQAPVANPDGVAGIALHVDNGPTSVMNPATGQTWGALSDQESLAHQDVLGSDFTSGGETFYDWSQFESIRQTRFAAARRAVFHYSIAAHSGPSQRFAGIARGIPAADFLITTHENCGTANVPLADECAPDGEYLAATFMHELGHTLGLRHGGTDGDAHKPNYLSIMNYNFGFGLVLFDGSHELDYSRYQLSLDENDLDEQRGFGIDSGPLTAFRTIYRCPSDGPRYVISLMTQTVDWDCNGSIFTVVTVAADVSDDDQQTTLSGPIDWDRLVFSGGGVGDLNQPPAPASTVIDEPTPTELIKNRALLDQGLSPQPGLTQPDQPAPPPGDQPAPPGANPADTTAPQTKLERKPKNKLRGSKAAYEFSASEPGASFECKLDRKKFKPCKSPRKLKRLKRGKHRFEVRAIDAAGNVDPSPAKDRFKVLRGRR